VVIALTDIHYIIKVTRYAFIAIIQVHTNPDMEYRLPTYRY